MTQRRLLFTALAIVMAVGLTLLLGNNSNFNPEAAKKNNTVDVAKCEKKGKYYRDNKKKCDNAIAAVPSPSPLVSPTIDPNNTSPNPNATPATDGATNAKLSQRTWQGVDAATTPIVISTLPDATAQKDCDEVPVDKVRSVDWNKYTSVNKIQVGNSNLISRVKNKLDNTHLISSVFSINEQGTGSLKQMSILAQYEGEESFRLFYRISDQPTSSDSGWTELKSGDIAKKEKCGKDFVYLYNINKPAKYFQYKVQLVPNKISFFTRAQRIRRINMFVFDPNRGTTPAPNPDPKVSPTPDPTGEGKLNISTQRLVYGQTTPSPSPSSNALLPTGSPKPVPSMPTIAPNLCSSNANTEPVANISLSIKQLTTDGKTGKVVEDQQTDEEGLWTGIDGEEDTFPNGNYKVTFGAYSDNTHRLVALCDPEDKNIINSQTKEKDRSAVVKINANATTKLVALYAPSNNPYIAMKKYALPTPNGIFTGPQRDLKLVYPGQSFTYYISYENTGGETAKEIVIRDVIPGQFTVNEDALLNLHPNAELSIDIRGGTLVTIPIDDLAAGAKGGIKIPVTLKANAFADTAQSGTDNSAQGINLN